MTKTMQWVAAAVLSLSASAWAAGPLKVGVSAVTAPSLEAAAQEARRQGLDVQVVEFSDWTAPNAALNAGDLDANFFQHLPFLGNAIEKAGYQLRPVGVGLLTNIGVFSRKYTSLSAIPEGATVSVYDDVTNQGRHLLFLQKLGLIELKDPSNRFSTIHDIAHNPKKLKLIEIPGPQLARALADVDMAVGAPLYFVAAGQLDVASSGLAYSGAEDVQYAIHFVARKNANGSDAVDPRLQQLIDIYQNSDVVRQKIFETQGRDARLYSLPWLNEAKQGQGGAATAQPAGAQRANQ
ncbi:MetQ/NlpA family ABC transporter substrate-binding protein [Lampropedia puyangensis]|uniref:MetQ/NlpA family ABC transporter substrate-binding protein n=2 Tax=Lampropedia puyangensis TaxID=1330072 RepID=A0A4S8EYI2_9BURK|nr:MetQ/NlpA family ABC transporter substrate-binding protein [Lampropedia puyangensis]